MFNAFAKLLTGCAFAFKIKKRMRFEVLHRSWRDGFKLLIVMALVAVGSAMAQKRVDRSVATINDGVRTEIITYSDLLWQLALQPGTAIDPPTQDDLNRALQTLINQRLFALEAQRIPRAAPTDDEVKAEVKDLISRFPSPTEFERRLNRVGFTSVTDDNFEEIIAERLAIKKYLDFRFRSFIVITPADEDKYYRDIYTPEFRKRFPGVVIPSLEDKRVEIRNILTEDKVSQQIETFLDEAKRRVEIVILSDT
jgi:hypothetical protein